MQQDRQLSADLSACWDPMQGLTGCSGGLCSRIGPWGHRGRCTPRGPRACLNVLTGRQGRPSWLPQQHSALRTGTTDRETHQGACKPFRRPMTRVCLAEWEVRGQAGSLGPGLGGPWWLMVLAGVGQS